MPARQDAESNAKGPKDPNLIFARHHPIAHVSVRDSARRKMARNISASDRAIERCSMASITSKLRVAVRRYRVDVDVIESAAQRILRCTRSGKFARWRIIHAAQVPERRATFTINSGRFVISDVAP